MRSINENRLKYVADDKNYRFDYYLTLADIRFLADFEYPDPSAIQQVFTEQTRITLPSAGSPLNLRAGTSLVEVSVLVSVIYFWLYQREARFSRTFPAAGTLFAVFNRTRTSRALLFLFASIPAVSAILLARWSLASVRTLNSALALFVVVFCIPITRQAVLGATSLAEAAGAMKKNGKRARLAGQTTGRLLHRVFK
jgi:hypothetical protein